MSKRVSKAVLRNRVKGDQADKIVKRKRIREVMDWILQDRYTGDMVADMVQSWEISDRQAMRYLAVARKKWEKEEDRKLECQRQLKILSLNRLKNSLLRKYAGTPAGIRAVLAIEKQIIELKGLNPATELRLTGPRGGPIRHETTVKYDKIDYSKLSDDTLREIMAARQQQPHTTDDEDQLDDHEEDIED